MRPGAAMSCTTRRTPCTWLGAPLTVGLRAGDAGDLDRTVPYQYWQAEVGRYLEVVGLLGATPVRIHPVLEVTGRDLAAAGSVLSGSGIDDDEALVVVHPGATDPRRRWPAQRFATVAHGLAAAGARVVVVGSAPEAALVARVADAVPGAVALAGVLDLPGLAGLLARAALLVGNDSGPRHLAEAVGTRTVSVYWFGNVINAAPATRQRHRVHISWTTRCPVCNLPCVGEPFPDRCPHDVSFVADVAVDLVRDSARALLADAMAEGTADAMADGMADAMADGTVEEPGAATPGSATPAGPGWAARGSAARAISPG